LSAQRIYQDLVGESGFAGSYIGEAIRAKAQVERAAARLAVESRPGEEMQVDFGLGAPLELGAGKTRRSWVFRVVLSYSRKGLQRSGLAAGHGNLLALPGECCAQLWRDAAVGEPGNNLKAAVLQADWFDPEVNPKLAQFCRHYGMNVLPCRPYTPQHKGKIERGICYVRGNALKGRRFASLGAQKPLFGRLGKERGRHPHSRHDAPANRACFAEERPHLQPLPAGLFPCYQRRAAACIKAQLCGSGQGLLRDAAGVYRRAVWARWDGRTVRLLNERLEQIAMHTRLDRPVQPCLGRPGERTGGPVLPLLDRPGVFVRRRL